MPKKRSKPSYLLHNATGRARVRIDGRDYYLKTSGSAESRDAYDELVAEWLARQDTSRVRLTVDDLALHDLEHAGQHYRKDGKPTSELSCNKTAPVHRSCYSSAARMTWQNLLNSSQARRHTTSQSELDGLRAVVERDLADAVVTQRSAGRRYAMAYNGARQASTMSIACAS